MVVVTWVMVVGVVETTGLFEDGCSLCFISELFVVKEGSTGIEGCEGGTG